MLSRVKLFPKCLPAKEDLQAVYLGKVTPSSAGTVTDESGNSNDAQLVNSNCATFDGTANALFTAIVQDGSYLDWDFIIESTKANDNTVVSCYVAGSREFAFIIYSNSVRFYFSQDGTSVEQVNSITNISDGHSYRYKGSFKDGFVTNTVTDVTTNTEKNTVSIQLPTITSLFTSVSQKRIGGGAGNFVGKMIYLKIGYAEFNFAEGGLSDTLYNTKTEGVNATITGATLSTFWGSTQDIYHYNILNGFDLYENGTAGQEIRIPIGATIATAGYTYTSTNIAGKWHNNAESKMQLPATLKAVVDGDCPNPLSYSEMETNFNDANSAFSSMIEGKHSKLVFYDRVLTIEEMLKLQKCLDVKSSEYVLTDENGVILTDENGLILVAE